MIEFSVIIPAKNEAKNIGPCIESIQRNVQDQNPYEIILVDNGSEDATVSIARSKGATVYIKPDMSISALRNFGAEVAKGNILAFMDADCTVSDDWLCAASRYSGEENIACYGSPPRIPESHTWVQSTWYNVRRKDNEVSRVPWLESMNMFVPKDLFIRVGGFNESLLTCEDVDISYRLSKHGDILSDTNIRAVHHGEAKTISDFFKKERWRGQSNMAGIKEHGVRLDELPSILLPLYFGLMPLLLCVFGSIYGVVAVLLLTCLWQAPILLVSYLKLRKKFEIKPFFSLAALYNVYYAARFTAMLMKPRRN